MKKLTIVLLLLIMVYSGFAQDNQVSSEKGKVSLGVGLGLPYGAFGARVGYNVIEGLNLFGGIGYQLSGVGYNFGLRKDFRSSKMVQLYITGMYGTNGAIKVDGLPEYDKVYTGASFGLGIKLNSKGDNANYWDFGLLYPIRSSSFNDDYDTVKNDPRISDISSPWPVLIVIGYNFTLN